MPPQNPLEPPPKRSSLAFDRGGQTTPPRSNAFLFGAADDPQNDPVPTTVRQSSDNRSQNLKFKIYESFFLGVILWMVSCAGAFDRGGPVWPPRSHAPAGRARNATKKPKTKRTLLKKDFLSVVIDNIVIIALIGVMHRAPER